MAQVDQIRLAPVKAKGSQRNSREFRNVPRQRIRRGSGVPQRVAHTQFVQDHGQTPSQIVGIDLPSASYAHPDHHYRLEFVVYDPTAEIIPYGGWQNDSFPVRLEGSAEPFSAMPSLETTHTNWYLTDPDYLAPLRLTGESEVAGEQSTALVTLYGLLGSGPEEMPHDKEWIQGSRETLLATNSPDFDLAFPHRDRPRSMTEEGVISNILSFVSTEFETPAWSNPPQSVADSQPSVPIALVDFPINSWTVAVLSLSHPARYLSPQTPVAERINQLILEDQGNEELLLDRREQAEWLKQAMASHWGFHLPQPFIGFASDEGLFIASWQSDNECNTLAIDSKEHKGWYDPWPAGEGDNPIPEEIDLDSEDAWERLRTALTTISP